MNFRQLEVLVSVIRLGSFSKAAEELFLTQPTVSSHVSALESELGVQLVTRSHKNVSPTRAGTVLYEYANGLLRMRDNVLDSMRHYPELLGSTLTIAASTVPSEYLLPPAMAQFRKDYPNVRFVVHESGSDTAVSRILSGEADLGFVGAQFTNEKCAFEEIASDRLVIVTPNEAPYSAHYPGELPASVLEEAPFLLRSSGSATQKEADSFLINMGIAPQNLHVAAYMDSIEAIKQSVKHGVGIAILSESAVVDLEMSGELLVFRNENTFMHRKLYCVYRTDQSLAPAADLFLNFMRRNKK